MKAKSDSNGREARAEKSTKTSGSSREASRSKSTKGPVAKVVKKKTGKRAAATPPVVPADDVPPVVPADDTPPVVPADGAPPVVPIDDDVPPVVPADDVPPVVPADDTPPVVPADGAPPVVPIDDDVPPVVPADESESSVTTKDGEREDSTSMPDSEDAEVVVEGYPEVVEVLPEPIDGQAETVEPTEFIDPAQEGVVDNDDDPLPNHWFLRKWCLMVSAIRGEARRKCRDAEIIKLADELEKDIKSAQQGHTEVARGVTTSQVTNHRS